MPHALYCSLLICWVTGAVLSSIAYARGKWKSRMANSIAHLNADGE